MYVCMYVCMYECMYVCMCVCMSRSMYVCMYACIYVSMYVSMYVSIYLLAYVFTSVCMVYWCVYVRIITCVACRCWTRRLARWSLWYICVCICVTHICCTQVLNKATGEVVTAKDIILAPGSVPFVPPGVQVWPPVSLLSLSSLSLSLSLSLYLVCVCICEWVAECGSEQG